MPSLPTALSAAVQGTAGRPEVRVVVTVCHRLARACLHAGAATNRDLAGLSRDDQALDAIGDLFKRTADGRFPALETYFADEADELHQTTEAALIERLRPLVHGAVTDRLFESNGEVDASLARLIRAVKRAIRTTPTGRLHRPFGALRVTVAPPSEAPSPAGQPGRPTMPIERLAAHLAPAVRTGAQVPDLVAAALDLLHAHPAYRPSVPVTALALAIRTVTVEVGLSDPAALPTLGGPSTRARSLDRLVEDDVERLLAQTVAEVRARKRAVYVGRGKIAADLYDAYFEAARSYLQARYLPPLDRSLTQHEALRMHRPAIDRDTYRAEHRTRFEYLVRTVREAVEARLRRAHRGLRDDSA